MVNIYTRIPALCFLILASAFSGMAQTAAPTPPIKEEEGVIKVDSKLIVVPVSVTNAAGEPVIGLTAKDFTITEEGKSQKIESLGNAEQVPLEIALLFDVSASTDAMFRFQQETARRFLKEVLRPEDRATIFTVGQKPILIQGRETAEQSIKAILSIQPTKGATAFFDTVRQAADFLKINSPAGRRRVIVVISDGEDNFSTGVQNALRQRERKIMDNSPDPDFKKLGSMVMQAQNAAKDSERKKVRRALQDADVVHYSINPAGSSYQLNQMSVFGQENMQIFSADTGGTAFLPKFGPIDTKDQYQNQINTRKNSVILEQIFKQLANELRAQYLIQYYAETEHPNNKFVRLNVTLPARGDLKVRAREGYFATN